MFRFVLIVALVIVLLVAACTPPSPAEQPAPKQPPAAEHQPKADTPDEWEQVLAAARQEGVVSVIGPVGEDRRDVLTRPFEEKYDIQVDFLGASFRDAIPRITTERGAGQHLWDVMVGGALDDVAELGYFAPIEPALLLPEITDQSTWRDGEIEYLDEERTIIVMTPHHRATLFVNATLVDPGEFTSYRDLLDPRWSGQLVADDPTISGPGRATFTFFYLHPDLGPDFIRELAQQDLLILRDRQQQIDTVGQGRHPIIIGTADSSVLQRQRQGVPIEIVPPTQLREGSDVSPAAGMVAMFDNQPNPNAARVYVNWLLSKEGQDEYILGAGYVSNHLGARTDHTFDWRIPQPGAIKTYTPEVKRVQEEEIVPFLMEVFGQQ